MRVLSMDWRDVLVASWPVDPAVVADTLPDRLDVDTFDDRAYLSVVPFVMENVRPYGFPRAVGPSFGELNLRTYVETPDGGAGIYFYNLDADDRIGVTLARTLFRLPYYRAEMDVDRRGESVDFRSERVHSGVRPLEFDATYEPVGEPSRPESGSLEEFLLERYAFYTEGRDTLWRGDVEHERWPLADASLDVRENEIFRANGFDHPERDAHLTYSPGVDVDAHFLRRV
ncbi:YqjF family protein [Halospeciosus flavus]|uniref:YqjF family protein n=1 Tax=Halospeciosus flavus TaxID=3032283 RepID=A0ABD5Z1E9_9EURY|nr:DUF2071 domain-containing protein [Halospeciosus flavus]